MGRSCWRQVSQKPRRERYCTLARRNSIAALAPCGVSGKILKSVTNGCSAMELCCGRSRTPLQQLTSACSSRSSCFCVATCSGRDSDRRGNRREPAAEASRNSLGPAENNSRTKHLKAASGDYCGPTRRLQPCARRAHLPALRGLGALEGLERRLQRRHLLPEARLELLVEGLQRRQDLGSGSRDVTADNQ